MISASLPRAVLYPRPEFGIAASPYGQVVGVGAWRQLRVAQDIAVGPVGEYPFTTARRSAPWRSPSALPDDPQATCPSDARPGTGHVQPVGDHLLADPEVQSGLRQ